MSCDQLLSPLTKRYRVTTHDDVDDSFRLVEVHIVKMSFFWSE